MRLTRRSSRDAPKESSADRYSQAVAEAAVDGYRAFTINNYPMPDLLFYACETCGAMVTGFDTDTHTTWHAA